MIAMVLSAAAGSAACGKKSSPLPPFVRIPAAVDKIAAVRLGNEVYVTLMVPAANVDTSLPVDIGRVDIYAYTGQVAPTPVRWGELGDVIASVQVAPPPLADATAETPPARVPSAGALPGSSITVLDTLTPDKLTQGRLPVDFRRPDAPRLEDVIPVVASTEPLPPPVLKRFYMAMPYSRRGRNGPHGAQAELLLTALPDSPSGVHATYDASTVAITWDPSGGLVGFLLERGLSLEPTPFDVIQQQTVPVVQRPSADIPPGPTTYNVYREVAPDWLTIPTLSVVPPGTAQSPATLNVVPLANTSATDVVEFGRQRCYFVRALRGAAISAASARTCVTPIDVFPPATPSGLAAVPSAGGISLIWEPNIELDLAGYLVLRREPGDATLRQLTATPIVESRYRDATVRVSERYIYSVVAVDAQLPLPNISAESEPVEETAR